MFSSVFVGLNFGIVTGADSKILPKASYVVSDVNGLQNMNLDLAGDYTLANDIDASATSGWNGGLGFVPIGTFGSGFSGSLDGQGFTISNLFINRSEEHTSELQSHSFISYAVFCLKKKK